MSEQPMDNTTGDWRRRGRRGGRARSASRGTGKVTTNDATETEEVEVTSRTLFSFLEPSLNTIGSFGAPLVIAGIFALIVGITLIAFVGSMRLYGFIILGFGAALIALVGLISLSSVVAAFISRTGRYGVNSLIMLAAFLGIVIVANFVSFENNNRIDATATSQFSLADRTEQLLDDLEQEIEVIAFYKEEISLGPQGSADTALRLLNRENKVRETFREFEAARPTKFQSSFVDPDVNPQRVNQYFGTTPTTFVNESIVVKLKDSEVIDVIQPQDAAYSHLEQDLVSSILLITGQEQKAIYFLSGHGERSISAQATDAEGYTSVRTGLEQDNYRVETLRWVRTEEEFSVPEDTALLVIARPTEELPQAQAEVLNLYLQGKNPDGSDRREAGRLIFLGEPDTHDTFREFLASWGVAIDAGYIWDADESLPNSPETLRLETFNTRDLPRELAIIIGQQSQSEQELKELWSALSGITAPKGNALPPVIMSGTASLQIIHDGNPARKVLPMAVTTDSYLIDDITRTEPNTESGENADPFGNFTPVVFVEAPGPVGQPPTANPASSAEDRNASLVVMGDSDFVANSFFDRGSGSDLFLNSVNYLVGDYSLVSLRPKTLTVREFNVDRNQENFVKYSSWLLLPGLMGLLAALVWWVRR